MRLGFKSTIIIASALPCAAGAASFAAALALQGFAPGGPIPAAAWAVAAAACLAAGFLAAALAAVPASRGARAAALAARSFLGGDAGIRIGGIRGPRELRELASAFDSAAEAAAKAAEGESAAAPDPAPGESAGPARRAEVPSALKELPSSDDMLIRETKMALRMQRRIVPKASELPTRPELAFGAAYLPAENTGGDIYDAVRAGKNGYAFLVADVAGRGVPAALVSAMVKNSFRSKATWHADAGEVMAAVNEELVPVLCDTENFVTAFYCVLDLESGSLSYANAGHPPAILARRRLSSTEDLDGSGGPMGIREGEKYPSGQRRLEEGDRLVFFTDGVTSARDFRGEEFSRGRLSAAVVGGAKLPVAELASSLSAELASFSIGAPRSDDTVLMICEFRSFARPPGSEPPKSSRGDADYPTLSRKGAFLASSGRIAEAALVYERLLELEPEDATALSNLGTLYWKLGRRAEAAQRFREAARLDPQDPRIARNLALAERSANLRAAPDARPPSEGEPPEIVGALEAAPAPARDEVAEEIEEIEEIEEAEPVDGN
jgi:serine phosphatase RsbU (regulator of sigma subunit)